MNEEEKQQKTIQHLQFMLDEKILPEIQELKENMDGLRVEFKEGFNHLATQITGTYSEYNQKYVKKDMFEEILKGLVNRIEGVEKSKASIWAERIIFGFVGMILLSAAGVLINLIFNK